MELTLTSILKSITHSRSDSYEMKASLEALKVKSLSPSIPSPQECKSLEEKKTSFSDRMKSLIYSQDSEVKERSRDAYSAFRDMLKGATSKYRSEDQKARIGSLKNQYDAVAHKDLDFSRQDAIFKNSPPRSQTRLEQIIACHSPSSGDSATFKNLSSYFIGGGETMSYSQYVDARKSLEEFYAQGHAMDAVKSGQITKVQYDELKQRAVNYLKKVHYELLVEKRDKDIEFAEQNIKSAAMSVEGAHGNLPASGQASKALPPPASGDVLAHQQPYAAPYMFRFHSHHQMHL